MDIVTIALYWKQFQFHKVLVAIILGVLTFLLIKPTQVFAQKKEDQNGFHQITVATDTDWVAISPNATKMAVVHAPSLEEFPGLGESLKIYQLDTNLQPKKVLFDNKDTAQLITEIQWVGDVFFYTTIEGYRTSRQYWDFINHSHDKNEMSSFFERLKLKSWPQKIHDQQNFKSLHFSPPGQFALFAGVNNTLLAFDPLDKVLQLEKEDDRNHERTLNTRFLDIYQVPQGTLINSLKIPLPSTGYRWWSQQGKFIPLFVSEDGRKLIAMVSSYYPWSIRSEYNVPFIISVDLEIGKITAITPDSELHGLRSGRDLRYFEPGNPMPVDGGSKVVFNLNMVRTINDIIAYFAYYDLDGKRIKEVAISKQDLKRAGIPVGSLLTWTPDGKKVLLQSEDGVWLVDIEKWIGRKIANGIWVDDTVHWIDGHHLLVRVRKLTDQKVDQRLSRTEQELPKKVWGILSLS